MPTTPTIELPKPLPHQLPVLKSPARFKMPVCGRRWGKTATGLMAATVGHGPTAGILKGALDGGTIWWVAPAYPQIESSKIWRDLKRACRGAWTRCSEVDRTIDLPGGGSITVKSADNEASLLGAGLDGLIIDEASRIKPEIWRETLRPMLADKHGWAMFLTTPNGKNWFHKLFIQAKQMAGWETWQLPSSDNPLITAEELALILQEIGPRAFAQEHLAQFTDIEGALFPAEYFEDHIHADYWPDAFEVSVIALDPSIGSESRPGDYSAIAFAGLSGGLLWVEMDLARRPPVQMVQDVYEMAQRYQPITVAVESNGFQAVLGPLFDLWCRQQNVPPLPLAMLPNYKEKKGVRIQRLDPYLANKELRFFNCPGCEMTIEQLQMFPDKDWHDDGPDALEMAIRTLLQISQRAGADDFELELARI